MSDTIRIVLNGKPLDVAPGITVAAAVMNAGVSAFRKSVDGQSRGPLCGMGICYECRATVDGHAHQKSCQVVVRDGMQVVTDEA